LTSDILGLQQRLHLSTGVVEVLEAWKL